MMTPLCPPRSFASRPTLTGTLTLPHTQDFSDPNSAEKICTSITDMDAEREHVTRALSSNGYPKVIVDRNRPPTSHPTFPPHEQETPKAVVTLPYIRHLSESLHRILTPLGIRTCFRPHQTLRRTFACTPEGSY